MSFKLSRHTVLEYLVSQNLCDFDEIQQQHICQQDAKNFNLKVPLKTDRHLLVKQELCDQNGEVRGEFLNEWSIRQLIQSFPELTQADHWLPKILHFDSSTSILILEYLNDYQDLSQYYKKEQHFSPEIAGAYGNALATIHRATFNQDQYRQFLNHHQTYSALNQYCQQLESLAAPPPEILGQLSEADIKFLSLYQRYGSLADNIANLLSSLRPCCLTHNDLKLNNLLLAKNWKYETLKQDIRFIDWERATWGDPAWDLGALVAAYLYTWLSSLVVGSSLSVDESLALATIPLEQLQPSMGYLLEQYVDTFPASQEQFPNFLDQTIRFAGLTLIQSIQGEVQHSKTFSNTSIVILQVAKRLLSQPQDSLTLILGTYSRQIERVAA